MRYLLIKNKKIYNLLYKNELKRLQFKSVIYNRKLPYYIRQVAIFKLSQLDSKTSVVSLRQRCFFTNRSRSVFNFFKIARMKLRLLISNNYVNGLKKSSW